jgi:hypothetical protein
MILRLELFFSQGHSGNSNWPAHGVSSFFFFGRPLGLGSRRLPVIASIRS